MARRVAAALALLALGAGGVGCGEAGVSSGATVRAYVGAPLCVEAKRELAKHGGRAGDVRVSVVCLAEARRGKRLELAVVGADARRASEDSTAIAFVEPAGPASRFSRTIVEAAGIGWTTAASGAAAMQRILAAVSEAGSGALRNEVREALEPS